MLNTKIARPANDTYFSYPWSFVCTVAGSGSKVYQQRKRAAGTLLPAKYAAPREPRSLSSSLFCLQTTRIKTAMAAIKPSRVEPLETLIMAIPPALISKRKYADRCPQQGCEEMFAPTRKSNALNEIRDCMR